MFDVPKKMAFIKAAGAAAFGLSLTLTACEHSSNNDLGFAVEDDPFASASSSSTVPNGDLGSSASTEGLKKYITCDKTIEGLYLKYLYSDSSDSDYAFFKCEEGEWKPVAYYMVPRTSGVFYVSAEKAFVCDADHEGVVDSVHSASESGGSSAFYYRRCEDGEWNFKNHSVTCDTAGVSVGDTCRRTEIVDFVTRGEVYTVETKKKLRDMIYTYAGNGKWEEFSCNTALPEECSPTDVDLSYEKISKDNGSYTYSIYCKCKSVTELAFMDPASCVGRKPCRTEYLVTFNKWHEVSENIYVPAEDSIAAASSFNPDEIRPCDKTLEIGDRVVKHGYKTVRGVPYGIYELNLKDSVVKYLYYKCKDGKWSILQEKIVDDDGNALDSASVISFAELGKKNFYDFKKCNADNEKLVDSLPSPDSKLATYDFYRCEQGSWVQRGPSVTCSVAGVSVGDTCKRAPFAGSSLEEVYVYAGDGIWEESKTVHLALLIKDCSAENEDSYVTQVDTVVKMGASPAYETSYYHCESSEWKRVDCLAPEAACTNSVEGKIDSTRGLLPLESRTQDVNTMTCRFTCSSGKWTRM